MKRLYIGLGISFALIVGGVAYKEFARSTVNMVELGNMFYKNANNYIRYADNDAQYKIASIDKNVAKIQIDFKKYSGSNGIVGVMQSGVYNDNGLKKSEKEAIQKFFNSINESTTYNEKGEKIPGTKEEKITYKWLEKPFNMSLATIEPKKITNKNGEDVYYDENKVLKENGEIPLSGEIYMKKGDYILGDLRVNGIRGSGVLEIEYKLTY